MATPMSKVVPAATALLGFAGGFYLNDSMETQKWKTKFSEQEKLFSKQKMTLQSKMAAFEGLQKKFEALSSEHHSIVIPGLETPVTGKQYTGDHYPKFTPKHKSAMAKYLSPAIWDKYKDTKSEIGVSLGECIKTGVDTPHLGVGLTAGDESCYEVFKDLFNPVIKDWHGYDPEKDTHKRDLNPDHVTLTEEQAKVFDEYVVSTRIRAARSLKGHLLPSSATDEDRYAVESKLKEIFETKFDGELKGKYYPLGYLSKEDAKSLRSQGFLFQMPKKTNLLYFSGAARSWPHGRGIFHNDDKTFLAWVNEEDHCRIISMAMGGNVKEVFARFCKVSDIFGQNADIMYNERLGFIGTCPSNLGTGLRASCMTILPEFNKDVHLLEEACGKLDLQPRGSAGEHSAAVGGKWDISNKQRIGFSEAQLVQKLVTGLDKLIKWEKMLASGQEDAVKAQIKAL